MFHLALFKKVSDLRFKWFGKLSVMPIKQPDYFELGLDWMCYSLPDLAHAWARSGPRMIMTNALFRPCALGRDSIPWWKIV